MVQKLIIPLQFDSVSLSYEQTVILDNIALEIGHGDRIIVVGENGAGKTTLIRLALGLLKPDSGEVRLFGTNPDSPVRRSEHRRAGYVHQGAVAIDFPISAREVVSVGVAGTRMSRGEKRDKIAQAMEMTGCLNLDARPYRVLSGGEKQRVSIARCLCQSPELLLLDEPFASLDQASCDEIARILEELPEEISVAMVSHRVSEETSIRGFSGWRFLHLENGKLS